MAPINVDTNYVKNYCDYHGGYFNALKEVKLVKVENGTCLAELTITDEHLNSGKTIHGGLIASIVDNFNCIALFSHKSCAALRNVTVDIHVIYIKAAKAGETIAIRSQVVKAGKTLGFVQCEVTNKETGELISTGNSNLVILRPKL